MMTTSLDKHVDIYNTVRELFQVETKFDSKVHLYKL